MVTCRRATGSGGESWAAVSGFRTCRLTDTYERSVDQFRNGSEFRTVVRLQVRFRSWKLIAGRRIPVADVSLEMYTVLWMSQEGLRGRWTGRRKREAQERGSQRQRSGCGATEENVPATTWSVARSPTLSERECGLWSAQAPFLGAAAAGSSLGQPLSELVFFLPSVLVASL